MPNRTVNRRVYAPEILSRTTVNTVEDWSLSDLARREVSEEHVEVAGPIRVRGELDCEGRIRTCAYGKGPSSPIASVLLVGACGV